MKSGQGFPIFLLTIFAIVTAVNSFNTAGTFHIQHWSSGKLVQPLGHCRLGGDTSLVLGDLRSHSSLFRFVPMNHCQGYGLFQHLESGMYMHPVDGSLTPEDEVQLVLHRYPHPGAWFKYDSERKYIIHNGGSFIQPQGSLEEPEETTPLVLKRAAHPLMKFVELKNRPRNRNDVEDAADEDSILF